MNSEEQLEELLLKLEEKNKSVIKSSKAMLEAYAIYTLEPFFNSSKR